MKNLFVSIDELLNHISVVEQDVGVFTYDAFMAMQKYIKDNNLIVDDELALALQSQDVIAQQLSATLDAINGFRDGIEHFEAYLSTDVEKVKHDIDAITKKFDDTTAKAREKREAYLGRMHNQDKDDEVEFF